LIKNIALVKCANVGIEFKYQNCFVSIALENIHRIGEINTSLTECDYVNKECAQYIHKNICQKFIDTWNDLSDKKIPPEHIIRGLSLALSWSTGEFTVTQNPGPEIDEIMDDVLAILEKSQKKGVHFACQAAALELLIPTILGIDYCDLA